MARLSGINQIRDFYKCSEATIIKLIQQEDFPAVKIGGIWESDTDIIEEWRIARIRERGKIIEKFKKKQSKAKEN